MASYQVFWDTVSINFKFFQMPTFKKESIFHWFTRAHKIWIRFGLGIRNLVSGGPHIQPEINLQREWQSRCYKFNDSRGNLSESVLKVSSACKRKDSSPCQNKNKASPLHGVHMIFLPPHNILIFLIFVLLSALQISRKAVWSHLEFWFSVCDMKWQYRLSWCVEGRKRSNNWAGSLSCLLCQAPS